MTQSGAGSNAIQSVTPQQSSQNVSSAAGSGMDPTRIDYFQNYGIHHMPINSNDSFCLQANRKHMWQQLLRFYLHVIKRPHWFTAIHNKLEQM